jgi:hypothetical protein
MTTRPTPTAALVIGSSRQSWKFVIAADPAEAPAILAVLKRMEREARTQPMELYAGVS